MKIDLHIGMHKTGTSSIQKFLSELSERDAYAPFVYPEAHKGNHSYLIGGGFGRLENADHHRMMKFGGTVPLKSARRSAARALIESGMIQADNKSVPLIISAEDASVLHRSEVEDLISFLDKKGASDIHVSFYARNVTGWCNSFAQERVKGGAPLSWIMDNPPFPRYREMLEPYINTVGKEKIRVRPYSRSRLLDGDVLSDYLSLVGIGRCLTKDKVIQENTGMSPIEGLIASQYGLDRMRAFRINHSGEGAALYAGSLDGKFALPLPILRDALRGAEEDANWLSQEFSVPVDFLMDVGPGLSFEDMFSALSVDPKLLASAQ